MDALRNGIAATARSASMPRRRGLPQFHPEDAGRRPAQETRHPTLNALGHIF